MKYGTSLDLGRRTIALDRPTYFIADVASNHDGSLDRARELIWLCHEAGADAVKFQHFQAEKIVSDHGFRRLGANLSHQASWSKPVFEVYRRYELDRTWTEDLAATARKAGIDFLTTPYDVDAIAHVAKLVPAFKIGSGDINWLTFIRRVAAVGKPVLLATGASDLEEVTSAVEAALSGGGGLGLMQCNTNYTGSVENFRFINLRVLNTFAQLWPGLPLGLSDHTPGNTTVLGAVALGARLIEKHFTDDNARDGPDHAFSMTPGSWTEMVLRVRELELSLGDGVKRLEENERDAAVIQRRCVRLARDVPASVPLRISDLECLRPAEQGSLEPNRANELVGVPLKRAMARGEAIRREDLAENEGVAASEDLAERC
jgi:sialic acid synthase SpsE